MRIARTAVFAFLVVLAFVFYVVMFARPAQGQVATGPSCGPHADMLKAFKTKYREEPSVWGLTGLGTLLEVLVSEKGTWTVLVTSPHTMIACVVASGTNWVAGDFIPGEDA